MQILHENVYHPIESMLLLIEGSWVVASHSCFPSLGNQSLMSLCLWQLWWWFSWSLVWVFASAHHVVCLVFLCTPLFGVRVLHLGLPLAAHICGCLAWFFLSPTLGAKIVSCLLPLSHLLILLMVHLLTLYLKFYHVTWRFLLKIKTKIPEVLTQYW